MSGDLVFSTFACCITVSKHFHIDRFTCDMRGDISWGIVSTEPAAHWQYCWPVIAMFFLWKHLACFYCSGFMSLAMVQWSIRMLTSYELFLMEVWVCDTEFRAVSLCPFSFNFSRRCGPMRLSKRPLLLPIRALKSPSAPHWRPPERRSSQGFGVRRRKFIIDSNHSCNSLIRRDRPNQW